ncbi:MAG: hypothetical protein V4461_11075 [Pseudomonadota bacterium]|tara:strand:- start:5907 stop:6119 length:213 start_codon:yes stop_codon:yes gene_type:complete
MAKAPVQKFYAQRDTAIDGQHFAAGDEVKGVSHEQLALAISHRVAGPEKPGEFTAAPEIDGADQEGNAGN